MRKNYKKLKWDQIDYTKLSDASKDNIEWGKSASPLVVDDLVIVTGGNSESECVVAYDRLTGELEKMVQF